MNSFIRESQGQLAQQYVDITKKRIYKQNEFFLEINLVQSQQLAIQIQSSIMVQNLNIPFSIDIFIISTINMIIIKIISNYDSLNLLYQIYFFILNHKVSLILKLIIKLKIIIELF